MKTGRHSLGAQSNQRGVTLIELLVGVAIGLLVIAVAMGALMVSRGVSGTVSDASTVQQQAAYAMRAIGLQLRQAGSLRLNLNPGTVASEAPYLATVGFETTMDPVGSANGFDPLTHTLAGTKTPVTVTVGYRRYTEPVFTSAAEQSFSRNCAGGPADSSADQRLESVFQLVNGELVCAGNGAAPQALVQNVANFRVQYLIQDNATPGIPRLRMVEADAVLNWGQVQAVEVCLVLFGSERIDIPAGSTYRDCNGDAVNLSTLGGARANRMHVVFRNVFQLRSQGLIGSVL